MDTDGQKIFLEGRIKIFFFFNIQTISEILKIFFSEILKKN